MVPAKQNSIISDQTGHTDANLEKMWLSKSALTQPCTYLSRGGFCSVHGTKVFIPSVLLCSCCCTQERKELQSMKQLFGRAPFCVGSASSSPDNRGTFLLCFLLVLAMTPASQICSCSGHTTHNKSRIISAVFADP